MLTVSQIIRCIKMDIACGRDPFGGLCHDKNPTPRMPTWRHVWARPGLDLGAIESEQPEAVAVERKGRA